MENANAYLRFSWVAIRNRLIEHVRSKYRGSIHRVEPYVANYVYSYYYKTILCKLVYDTLLVKFYPDEPFVRDRLSKTRMPVTMNEMLEDERKCNYFACAAAWISADDWSWAGHIRKAKDWHFKDVERADELQYGLVLRRPEPVVALAAYLIDLDPELTAHLNSLLMPEQKLLANDLALRELSKDPNVYTKYNPAKLKLVPL